MPPPMLAVNREVSTRSEDLWFNCQSQTPHSFRQKHLTLPPVQTPFSPLKTENLKFVGH